MTILEEARHSLILEVHDPMLFELKARLLICPRPSTLVAGREISKDFTDLWPEYIQKEANLFA